MIIADDFILATPARCGTYTAEAIARRKGWERVRPGLHRMIVPPDFVDLPRRIQVRDPYDRMESIYHYLHDPQNYSQWGAKEVSKLSFARFIRWYALWRRDVIEHGRYTARDTFSSPHLWLLSLSENADLLDDGGSVVLEPVRLETLETDLGVEGGLPHRHRRRNLVASRWTPAMLAIAAEWCGPDAERFGYPTR